MGYGRCDIQVLDEAWNVVETISNEDLKPVNLPCSVARKMASPV
jgi:hypothetical protein